MNLQTKIPIKKQSNNLIDYNADVLLFGSCFSENIGGKLDYFKFQNTQNPFGVLFHPEAINILVTNAIERKQYTANDVFYHNEQWHCFDAHSKLSHTSRDVLIKQLNTKVNLTSAKIKAASHIVITLGTAWVYRDVESNNSVANCHKLPRKRFEKQLLTVESIENTLNNILNLIRVFNERAAVIFTVSPVRHIKDGFIENTQSKAHLITAIHKVLNNQCFYFPAFEIMMDELRDYRFYNADMIHPSALAISYIWDIFKYSWINQGAYRTMDDVNAIQKGRNHKPFNSKSEAHQVFVKNLDVKIEKLQLIHKHISF